MRIFLGAFAQVGAVAWNVSMIAAGNYYVAFLSGGLVSWIWWSNSRRAAVSEGLAPRLYYTAGAAFGTIAGMAIARSGWLW